jgi:peroxiredoxin
MASCSSDDTDRTASDLVKVGTSVPEFVLTGNNGEQVTSSSLKGQVYILNFFDVSCPDCQQELQVLQKIYEEYGNDVPVLNVPRNQDYSKVQEYWTRNGLTVPFYTDGEQKLYYKFATRVIPRTYVIDTDGKIQAAYTDDPIADFNTLNAQLSKLLEGTVSFSMKMNASEVKQSDQVYFHNEYVISKADLFFFDSSTKKLFTRRTFTDLKILDDISYSKYDRTYEIEKFRLKAGVYDIFVVANFDNYAKNIEDEMDLLNMIDSVTYSGGIESNIPDTGPVMTSNAVAYLGVNLLTWINKTFFITIDVERVLAKLQVGVQKNYYELKYNYVTYADINITNYKVVNLNKSYYLFQHRDDLPEFIARTSFSMPDNFRPYVDGGDLYVIDPLFYEKTLSSSDAARIGSKYANWYGNYTTTDFASMPSAGNFGYAYILENTMYKDRQKNGYSTGIVFKAAVNPVFVYLYEPTTMTLKEERRPEYWPNTIYFYNFNFYGSIQALNVAGGFGLDELKTYTDAQLKVYGIKQIKFNQGAYETFYTYWIRHRNSSTDYMGPMQYGIVRNNYYKLVVSDITGIGSSVITPDIMRDDYPNSYSDIEIAP